MREIIYFIIALCTVPVMLCSVLIGYLIKLFYCGYSIGLKIGEDVIEWSKEDVW